MLQFEWRNTFHSEIQDSLNFNKNSILSPGLENIHTVKCCSAKFSKIIIYFKINGKIPDQHLSVWLFSNPWDKVHFLLESTRQICLHLFWTLSPGFENSHAFKCWIWYFSNNIWLWWRIARTIFQCTVVLQSRGQNFISVERGSYSSAQLDQ